MSSQRSEIKQPSEMKQCSEMKRGESRGSDPRKQMPWGDLPRPMPGAPGSRENPTPSGLLLIDKPSGVTSHDVVGAIRRLAGTRKVGHGGTLDPMATGLLTVGIGAGTKLLHYLSGHDKSYRATIRFGAATSTEDAEGELLLDTLGLCADIDTAQIDNAMAGLTGDIMQRPSAVSAIKVDGERSYDRVRRGENVQLPARPVRIESFVRLSEPRPAYIYQLGRPLAPALDIDVEVSCSAGTYIRALARDLGAALGMGAHLTMLRRIRVGSFDMGAAVSMMQLRDCVRAGQALPIASLAQAAAVGLACAASVTAHQAQALRHGQFIEVSPAPKRYPVALILYREGECAQECAEAYLAGDGAAAVGERASFDCDISTLAESGAFASAELVAIGKKRGKLVAPEAVFPAN